MKIPILASKINLSNLGLKEIPEQVFKCKNLKKLNLSNNNIKVIPVELTNLKYLKNLDLSNNEISILYAKNCSFQNLEVLILKNNKLKNIPKQIAELTKIRKLCLTGNNIKELPEEFGKLQSLQSLNIAGNDFISFPKSLLKLENLNTLWLNNNAFIDFPLSDIQDKLINLRALYTFSPISSSSNGMNLDYINLQKYKGNSLSQLNLLTLKSKGKNKTNIKVTNASNLNDTQTSVFISYCHIDDAWLKKLNTVLQTMEYEGLEFDRWDDTRIRTGDKWKEEIEKAIEKATVAILLVSNEFLASKFIREKEVPELLTKAKINGTKILPVIVGRCRFTQSVLQEYQSVNKPEKPLKAIPIHEQEEVFYNLTLEIDRILNKS